MEKKRVGQVLFLDYGAVTGQTGRYVRATLKDVGGNVLGAPHVLQDVGAGRYVGQAVMPAGSACVFCTYEVFLDSALTQPDTVNGNGFDSWELDPSTGGGAAAGMLLVGRIMASPRLVGTIRERD